MMQNTLKQLADALAAKTVSSRELVSAALARIDALNPQLNAFITVADPESALAAADAAGCGTGGGHCTLVGWHSAGT